MTRSEVYSALDAERAHQIAKRGPDHNLSVPGWLLVIREELDEAMRDWVRSAHGDDDAALREIVQVAACCIACLEQHGALGRPEAIPPVQYGIEKWHCPHNIAARIMRGKNWVCNDCGQEF